MAPKKRATKKPVPREEASVSNALDLGNPNYVGVSGDFYKTHSDVAGEPFPFEGTESVMATRVKKFDADRAS